MLSRWNRVSMCSSPDDALVASELRDPLGAGKIAKRRSGLGAEGFFFSEGERVFSNSRRTGFTAVKPAGQCKAGMLSGSP
jgi:hypothetical protein